jgi:hypothetical protein
MMNTSNKYRDQKRHDPNLPEILFPPFIVRINALIVVIGVRKMKEITRSLIVIVRSLDQSLMESSNLEINIDRWIRMEA